VPQALQYWGCSLPEGFTRLRVDVLTCLRLATGPEVATNLINRGLQIDTRSDIANVPLSPEWVSKPKDVVLATVVMERLRIGETRHFIGHT
jgi:hypothetical protein